MRNDLYTTKSGGRAVEIPAAIISRLQELYFQYNPSANMSTVNAERMRELLNTPDFNAIRQFLTNHLPSQMLDKSKPSDGLFKVRMIREENDVERQFEEAINNRDMPYMRDLADFAVALIRYVNPFQAINNMFYSGVATQTIQSLVFVGFPSKRVVGFSSSKPINKMVYVKEMDGEDFKRKISLYSPSCEYDQCGMSVLKHICKASFDKTIEMQDIRGVTIEYMKKLIQKVEVEYGLDLLQYCRLYSMSKAKLETHFKTDQVVKFHIGVYNKHWYVFNLLPLKRKLNCSSCGLSFTPSGLLPHEKTCGNRMIQSTKNKDIKDIPLTKTKEEFLRENEAVSEKILNLLRKKESCILKGMAGTGKSITCGYILSKLKGHIISPTGKVACNFDGICEANTWHSVFPYNFMEGNINNHVIKKNFNTFFGPDIQVIIIDEVGMIRRKDLENMNKYLQIHLKNEQFFGGIPVLMVGDAGQLPPIEDDSDSGENFFFLHPKVREMVLDDKEFTLNQPFRYIQEDIQRGIEDFNIIQQLQCGKIVPEFFNRVQCILPSAFKGVTRDLDIVILTHRKENITMLMNAYHKSGRCFQYLSRELKTKIYFQIGGLYMITSNIAVSRKDVVNGTLVVLDKIENEKTKRPTFHLRKKGCLDVFHLTVKIEDMKKGVELTYGQVMTIHKAQGSTFDKVIIIDQMCRKGKSKGTVWSPGLMVTAITRCRALKDVTIVTSNIRNLFKQSQQRDVIKVNCLCRDFMLNSKKPIPMNKLIYKNKWLYNKTTNDEIGVYQIEDKRTRTKNGEFVDQGFTQNDIINNCFMEYDIETRMTKKSDDFDVLEWVSVGAYFFYKGTRSHPVAMMEDMLQHLDLPFRPMINYDIHEDQYCEWSMYESDQVGFDFAKTIFDLLYVMERLSIEDEKEAKNTFCAQGNKQKQLTQRQYEMRDIRRTIAKGLIIGGYNNNNFDNFGFIQEFIRDNVYSDTMYAEAIPGGGNSIKGFCIRSMVDPNRVLLSSHDLFQCGEPCSLDAAFSSYTKGVLGNVDQIYSEDGPLTLMERVKMGIIEIPNLKKAIQEDFYLNRGFNPPKTEEKKIDKRIDKMVEYFHKSVQRTDPKFMINLCMEKHGKGSFPHFIWRNFSLEECRQFGTINLKDFCQQHFNGDWSQMYPPRDLDSDGLPKDLPDDWEHFNVRDVFLKYQKQDVKIQLILYRIRNNSIYFMDKENQTHASGHHGLRLSILSVQTAAGLSDICTSVNYPKSMILNTDKKDSNVIQTNLPLYQEPEKNFFKNFCGGKVVPRVIHYKSLNGNQFCVALDVSGLYGDAMLVNKFPTGRFKQYFKGDPILEKTRKEINAGRYNGPIFMGIGCISHHPKEVEPVIGIKTKEGRIHYVNHPISTNISSITLPDLIRSGGTVHAITFMQIWEKEEYIFSKTIATHTKIKNNSKGAKRNTSKLINNSAYGATFKDTPENSGYLITNNALEISEIMDKATIKNYQIQGDKVIIQYEGENTGLSERSSHLGACVLEYSKKIINNVFEIGLGKERHSNVHNQGNYSDTDSWYPNETILNRLIHHDLMVKDKPEKRVLWCPYEVRFNSQSMDPDPLGDFVLPALTIDQKSGKLTEEIGDDVSKMDKEWGPELEEQGFPCLFTGFHAIIVEQLPILPKVNIVHAKIPPPTWEFEKTSCYFFPLYSLFPELWKSVYKITFKGVRKGSYIFTEDHHAGTWMKSNKETFDMIKNALLDRQVRDEFTNEFPVEKLKTLDGQELFIEQKGLHSVNRNQLRKYIVNIPKAKRELEDVESMSILSINEIKKTCLKTLFRGREWISTGVPTGTLKECFEGYTLPIGYQKEPYSKEQIDKGIEQAKKDSLFLYKQLHV